MIFTVIKKMVKVSIYISLNIFFLLLSSTVPLTHAEESNISGKEVVGRCNYKYQGDDGRSRLAITLIDKNGNEKKTVSMRLWKDYKGNSGVNSKMALFTEFPIDAKGSAFMRWDYSFESGKTDDLWLYLPTLRKVRKVSVRDMNDSFMGSDLTYADVSRRELEQDNHKLLTMETDKDKARYYVVESIPKEDKPFYSKRISWFKKGDNWDSCVKVRVDYYNRKGEPLKREFIQWKNIGKAWVWDNVLVKNFQTLHSSIFKVTDVEINVGLTDNIFTERSIKLGLR